MCGICGFYGQDAKISKEILERMNQMLVRRGPDESGIFWESEVGLAMRRLSIIDLDGGHQPIQNEDGTVWTILNGEIYNYRELRKNLIQRGHQFRTHSDTEVIVHLYEEYQDNLVYHLRGMFAFALWDVRRKRGLIARDRLGIKPLFYALTGNTLLFGSEIKAILATNLIRKELDYQGLDAFFAFTYIPAPLTIYRGIRKLKPGHLLSYEEGKIESRCYWDLELNHVEHHINHNEWVERFNQTIEEAVAAHLVSDVPIGAFLSGGIDSGLVVALMSSHLNESVETFTMGFGGLHNPLIDERPLAKNIAGRYGCEYHEYLVQPDFRKIVGEIVDAFDEPFADDSVIPTYYICHLAQQKVKVVLSGLGGDELFAGYERYFGVWLSQYYARLVPSWLHLGLVQPFIQRIPEPNYGGDRVNHAKRFSAAVLQSSAERYLGFISSLTSIERRQFFTPFVTSQIDFNSTDWIIKEPFEKCGAVDDLTRALYTDIKTYLPEDILALSDRLSMWHSLEVRVPLVDHSLVELSAQLPTRYKLNWGRKKILLKQIATRYLPTEILSHRKQGFESPMASWLRTNLADYARDILGQDRLGKVGLFNWDYVSLKLEEHLEGRHKNNKLLFALIMFQEWYERHYLIDQ
ncbi:MAG: asparagine synthase (glutamine-hydrolyzing) [Candidatus Competibacteraceae bacterium]|nr:asparagine synthase (glutamine-hydrolyzing) [Candidatus Competibacteraceae bacterium]